jgi:hypothetical protein
MIQLAAPVYPGAMGSPRRRRTCAELRRRSGAAPKSPRPAGNDDERPELSSEVGTGSVVHRPPRMSRQKGDRRRHTREGVPLDWAMTQAPSARWGAVPSRRRPRRPRLRAGRAARRWTRRRCYWSGAVALATQPASSGSLRNQAGSASGMVSNSQATSPDQRPVQRVASQRTAHRVPRAPTGSEGSITGCLKVFRSRVPPSKPIDGSRAAARRARMANIERAAELSDLHMIVLGRIARHASADVEDVALWPRRAGGGGRGCVRGLGRRGPCQACPRALISQTGVLHRIGGDR